MVGKMQCATEKLMQYTGGWLAVSSQESELLVEMVKLSTFLHFLPLSWAKVEAKIEKHTWNNPLSDGTQCAEICLETKEQWNKTNRLFLADMVKRHLIKLICFYSAEIWIWRRIKWTHFLWVLFEVYLRTRSPLENRLEAIQSDWNSWTGWSSSLL